MRKYSFCPIALALLVPMGAPWSSARADSSHILCNRGNTDIFVAVVDDFPRVLSVDYSSRGWWKVKAGDCETVWTGGMRRQLYIGITHAGSNMKNGVGLYNPSTTMGTIPYKYFCVHPTDEFHYRSGAGGLRDLTHDCPAGAKLMRFSYGLRLLNYNVTYTLAPDANEPVMPFGKPGESAPPTRNGNTSKPEPRTTTKNCEDYEPLFRPQECDSSPQKNVALRRADLMKALAAARKYFSDLKIPSNNSSTAAYRVFLSRFKYHSIDDYCGISETWKDGHIRSASFGCSTHKAESAAVLRAWHQGIGRAIERYLGIAPSIDKEDGTSYLKRFSIDGDGLFVNLVSQWKARKSSVYIYYDPGKCRKPLHCQFPENLVSGEGGTSQATTNTKTDLDEGFCPALLKASREASGKFEKLRGENIAKGDIPLYSSAHIVPGFNSCTIGDHGGSGAFVCGGGPQLNGSESKGTLRDYARRISDCTGATPTVNREGGLISYVFDSKSPPEARLTLHLSPRDGRPVLMIFPPVRRSAVRN